jgi:phenylacetate-CoA ligase
MAAKRARPDYSERSHLERRQDIKLRTLLKTILPANAFYARKLESISPPVASFTRDDFFRLIPFTTKNEIREDQSAHPPYGTNLTFPQSTYFRCHQTSGSTGGPISWLDTPQSWNHIVENWVEILGAAGVTREDRFFFAFSFGPFLGFWSALEAAQQMGCFSFPGGAMTSRARLQAMAEHHITVLCCTPTYALHLGDAAGELTADRRPRHVRLIIVAGEPGGSILTTRSRIESRWPGAVVFDHHGMTEVGPVSYQCPAHPGVLHILESAYLPEVFDPHTGTPVSNGDSGELVLTTLDRLGSPLLRYRTGDLVKARPPGRCACGRYDLACVGGILGRSDDMVIVRGVNVYPSRIEEIVRGCPEVAEYRVTLDCRRAMAELSLEVESIVNGDAGKSLQQAIEESLESALNLRVPVRLCPAGFLPRFEMKAQRWIRLTA